MGECKISEGRNPKTSAKTRIDRMQLYRNVPIDERDETTSRGRVEREVWHQGLSWGDTLVFIYRQFRRREKKHFPKYLSFDVIWQLPVCCLSGASGVSRVSLFGWKEGRTVDGEEHGKKVLKYLLEENINSVRSSLCISASFKNSLISKSQNWNKFDW